MEKPRFWKASSTSRRPRRAAMLTAEHGVPPFCPRRGSVAMSVGSAPASSSASTMRKPLSLSTELCSAVLPHGVRRLGLTP